MDDNSQNTDDARAWEAMQPAGREFGAPATPDTSTPAVNSLAKFHEGIAANATSEARRDIHRDTADTLRALVRERETMRDEIAGLKADLDGAAHNRFYDQRDAYFEGVESVRR